MQIFELCWKQINLELFSGEEGDDSRDGLIEDNPEKGRRKFLIEELNNKDIDSSDVDITAMLDEIEEDMDLDELVRQKALLQEKLKKDGIDGISDEEMEEKDEEGGERARDTEEQANNGDRDGAENDNNGDAIDLEKPELVEIKSDSDDSDVEHLITLDRKREKKDRRSDSGRRESSRKDPKDLLKDRWGKRGDSREKDRESRDRDRGSRDRREREDRSNRRRSSRSREREIKERQKERELRHKAAEEKRGAGDLRDEQRRREGGRGERGRDDRSSRRRSRSRDKDRDKDRSDRRDEGRDGAQEESSDENLDIEINSEDSDEEAIIERKRKERAELLAKLAAGGPTAAIMHREKVDKCHSIDNFLCLVI